MNQFFYDTMFNPQYVNSTYYSHICQMNYNMEQDKKVQDAAKAMHDMLDAIRGMDDRHQQMAAAACLAIMAQEYGWKN